MSTQSGISVSEELLNAFQEAQAGDVRVLKVSLESERLIPAATLPIKGNETDDFDGIPSLLEESTPAYILVKLDSPSGGDASAGGSSSGESQWLLATYVPDRAQVRSKMLYSSTKATLARQLGEGKFKYTLFASVPVGVFLVYNPFPRKALTLALGRQEELSSKGYKDFLKHHSSSAPLTDREKEMAEIKEAEGVEIVGSNARRNHAGAQIGCAFEDAVEEALKALTEGEKKIVQLGIDTKTETVILLGTPSELSLPPNDPCYTFYAHSAGIVFIYCCPDTSPIRGRMIYSANCQPIVQDAKQRGVEVVKKIETSTPSEITAAFIDAELIPQQAEETSRTGTPTQGFTRPARPGRKR